MVLLLVLRTLLALFLTRRVWIVPLRRSELPLSSKRTTFEEIPSVQLPDSFRQALIRSGSVSSSLLNP
jgi:hypothetical protein